MKLINMLCKVLDVPLSWLPINGGKMMTGSGLAYALGAIWAVLELIAVHNPEIQTVKDILLVGAAGGASYGAVGAAHKVIKKGKGE